MNEELLDKHYRARTNAKIYALNSVNEMELPKTVDIFDTSFSGLGLKTSRNACANLQSLRYKYNGRLPHLFGLALREAWFALFDESGYIALMRAEGSMGDNDYVKRLATAEGIGEKEGIARLLYNQLSELGESEEQKTFRYGTPFVERLSLEDVLTGAATYWFAAAANSYRANDIQGAFNWLSEAENALSLAVGDFMWNEGASFERESFAANSVNVESAVRSALAKSAAQARHTENRSMKTDVFRWLDAHMSQFKSLDAAAEAIAGNIAPVVFRTARTWVADWKKSRSAGTP